MQTAIAPTPKMNGRVQSAKKQPNVFEDEVEYMVYKTYDLGKFKIMAENRNINLLHVRRLIESFKGKYLISPLVVNDRMEVIDGQHRLTASRELGLPVRYIMIDGYGIEEVQILNANQKNWQKLDYLHSYCSEGVKPYLQFKKFMEDFPELRFQSCERILTGRTFGKRQGEINGKKVQFRDFEEGKLVIPDLRNSYSIANKIMDFKPYFKQFGEGTFTSAILPLFKSKVYNHKEMIHKLSTCPIKMQKCRDVEAYRLLLEDIYNYKRLKENKVSFRYEN